MESGAGKFRRKTPKEVRPGKARFRRRQTSSRASTNLTPRGASKVFLSLSLVFVHFPYFGKAENASDREARISHILRHRRMESTTI